MSNFQKRRASTLRSRAERRASTPARVLSVLLACYGAACSDERAAPSGKDDGPFAPPNAGPGGAVTSPSGVIVPAGTGVISPAAGAAAGQVTLGEPTREQYCAGKGPPVSITQPQAPGSRCTTGIAASVFTHGLCSCSDAIFTGAFAIDAFDSGNSPAAKLGASVGVNDQLIATGTVDIHGSLIAAGRGALPITTGGYHIDGNFETNSDLFLTGANIRFGRDLWVNGDINLLGLASVAGDIHQTPGHALVGGTVGGKLIQHSFEVPTPCACGPREVLDIDAIVSAGIASSHNQTASSDLGSLLNLGTGGTLELGCGRFAFRDVHIVGATVLKTTGRTALFIDGDLTVTGAFGVELGATGELDVFVRGNLLITGTGQIGSPARPAGLRFYVGGHGDIAITGANRFAANLYAPSSAVFVTGAEETFGSFFVGSYHATGAQVMHYDAAITRTTAPESACEPPPTDCENDLSCPSPRVCKAGSCVPLDVTLL